MIDIGSLFDSLFNFFEELFNNGYLLLGSIILLIILLWLVLR